jgi:hypothetical protein
MTSQILQSLFTILRHPDADANAPGLSAAAALNSVLS